MANPATAVLLALASACLALAQTPCARFDGNQLPIDTLSSSPRQFVRLGSRVLFTATTPALGNELWALDLSTRTANLVADLAVGTASSSPSALTAFAGHVYFAADDGVHGPQLWRTDGTAAGTIRPDLLPGSGAPSEFAVANGKLFFHSNTGPELVVTDGSAADTQVLDILPGGNSQPRDLVRIGNEVWFSASTPAFGTELWRTDGTQAGTSLVFDANPGPAHGSPRRPVEVGSERLFAADNRLWRTDGTPAGTSELAASVREVVAAGNQAFFLSGTGLWRSLGTVATTQLVTTIPVPPLGILSSLSGFDTGLTFLAEPGLGGSASTRWVSDGTAAGTFALGATTTAPTCVFDGSHFYFAHATSGAGLELWRTDGTQAGTTLVADVVPGPVSSCCRAAN
jgi:ELWxxDGT repeat protein